MAATDKTYRNQKALDVVFAVSCVLMLLSIIGMFAVDFIKGWKVDQKIEREAEAASAQREALRTLFNVRLEEDKGTLQEALNAGDQEALEEFFGKFSGAEKQVADAQAAVDKAKTDNVKEVNRILAEKARADASYQGLKADYDSLQSIFDIAVEERDAVDPTRSATRKPLEERVVKLREELDALKQKVDEAAALAEKKKEELANAQQSQKTAEDKLSDAQDRLKKLRGAYDRYYKLAQQKRWRIGDSIRSLPILDAFASPTRIQQYTLADLPIDYSFKQVTRYDRCGTCHVGMEKLNFDKAAVGNLTESPKELQETLNKFRKSIQERKQKGEPTGGFDPGDLPENIETLSKARLTTPRINAFCSHPRLELFVDSNSPHPAQKFGCTICHAGQGSATDFTLASHTPNDAKQKEDWRKDHGWESIHDWDFPMLPGRFVESSCLKCHHQVTDLITYGNKQEAPKLMRGYNLIKDNGCFGCHEISGIKSGRWVGPDLRLEPSPPLEALTPTERALRLADPLNPPGNLRKVGPSLRRLSEKTNQEWVRQWIRSPRGFRPDTKMPHFYGLSNNGNERLPDAQKGFPDAEIYSIAYYLLRESEDYLAGKDKYRRAVRERIGELKEKQRTNLASEPEKAKLVELERWLELDKDPTPLYRKISRDGKEVAELHLLDSEGNVLTQLPDATEGDKAQLERGRKLFTERGCLACHSHDALNSRGDNLPAVKGEANFGPNLSRLAAKLEPEHGDKDARRRWLVQWVLNPNIHHPRTRMPITHLTVPEAEDVAAWLLNQKVNDWKKNELPSPEPEVVKKLANLYLAKAPGLKPEEVRQVLEPAGDGKYQGLPEERIKTLDVESDERELKGPLDENQLKWYIGKKSVSRLGCFGCHEIPGFETAKPIGTPLNDWGKKDPERLAFEDVLAYVRDHIDLASKEKDKPAEEKDGYVLVNTLRDKNGNGPPVEGSQEPYERYFLEALEHHHREGFLYQKLSEPRSYDYHRDDRVWDDRLRMPQFKFARGTARPLEGETMEQAEAREEADAREAVMTFILGLVAEPVPLKFVNNSPPDRLAEVKGRQVLDKYNCGGCHQVRSGTYEFKPVPGVLAQLKASQKDVQDQKRLPEQKDSSDYFFKGHNPWVGRPSPYTDHRLVVQGIPKTRQEEGQLSLWLTQAVQFTLGPGDVPDAKSGDYNIPAGEYLNVALADLRPGDLIAQSEPYGGTLAQLLTPYLQTKGTPYDQEDTARSALPPPLLREGEKVQPGWLFQFLRDPTKIRPQQQDGGIMVLRMPRFNMNDDEAMALVNYFAAADKIANPGEGLIYPYLSIPQREKEFWIDKTKDYKDRIKDMVSAEAKAARPALEQYQKGLKSRLDEAQKNAKAAEDQLGEADKNAKSAAEELKKVEADKEKKAAAEQKKKAADEARTRAEANSKLLQQYLKTLQAEIDNSAVDKLEERWRQQEVYGSAAYRLLVRGPCLECHKVGDLGVAPKGPPLDLAAARLRPEWTLQWIANPRRLTTYVVPMPQNFPHNEPGQYQEWFAGSPEAKITALRDLLMDYAEVADKPANRYYLSNTGGK